MGVWPQARNPQKHDFQAPSWVSENLAPFDLLVVRME